MRILDRAWEDGFLDEALEPGTCRLAVRMWVTLESVEGIYFQRVATPRLLFNYLREIGPRAVLHKVGSRRRERLRNRRYVGVGVAVVTEVGPGVDRGVLDRHVVFVAPAHPRCTQRIVLPPSSFSVSDGWDLSSDSILHAHVSPAPPALAAVAGWNWRSGVEPDELVDALAVAVRTCRSAVQGSYAVLPAPPEPVRERTPPSGRGGGVLVGYGNYAKSVILPVLGSSLPVRVINEIDPTQIGRPSAAYGWDTASVPRHVDASTWIIASHHHTHAPLAIEALRAGRDVVVEKPMATTPEQLDGLLSAMSESSGRLFAGFQRRYSPFTHHLREDVLRAGEPMAYAAVVFEEPLPPRHWYRWSASGSNIVSNGCHWLDHFLFLNPGAAVAAREVQLGVGGDAQVWVELDNGSVLSLLLTHRGSSRIGMQNHIEVRVGSRSARITNDRRYVAEDASRIIRRQATRALQDHRAMYEALLRALEDGTPGDTADDVRRTTSLTLELEALHAAKSQRSAR